MAEYCSPEDLQHSGHRLKGFGRRLLPQVVDLLAQTDPERVYASIPNSTTDLSAGFYDITMLKLSAMVNRISWWLKDTLGPGNLDTIAYVGPPDIRYCIIFLAAVKCGYKMLFISPRNRPAQNQAMMIQSGCRALFHAEEMSKVVELIRDSLVHELLLTTLPSLDDLLETPEDTEHFLYEKSFNNARNEPCLVLHSSGSTGDPKLVTMTHGTFACTDNDRNVQTPEGREPQNAAQFNFEGGGKFYSCFPPYHLAGVHAYIDLPIFSTSASVVFGPTDIPPSGFLLSEILRHQHIRAFYTPPFIIEQWIAEPMAAEQAKHLDFVLYGGGPLPSTVGGTLSQVTKVCQMYGSLEIGQVQLLVPQLGEWDYMELNPFEEVDMQPRGEGTFEMVLHQHPKFAAHRSVWHNFPKVKEWRTGDLFLPHKDKPGLWRFHGRLDDLIVLSSSHKLRPLEAETLIQGHPLLSGALIVGQGRPQPLLIVEPVPGSYKSGDSPQSFIDSIWSAVKHANEVIPEYAVIRRSMVLIADSERPFMRAPKGTIVRKLTTEIYAHDIELAYNGRNSSGRTQQSSQTALEGELSHFILSGLKQYMRSQIEAQLQGVALSDTDNIFLGGLDSLGAAELSRALQKGLKMLNQTTSEDTRQVSLREIYGNPTIERLAKLVYNIVCSSSPPLPCALETTDSMKGMLDDFTEDLPPRRLHKIRSDGDLAFQPPQYFNVAIIGPRGSLGPTVVKEMMENPRVASIYCLSRGTDAEERLRCIFESRNFQYNRERKPISFMSITLGKPLLGLHHADLHEILANVDIIIHNAWRVNFSWTLDSYRDTYLHSIRELVEVASLSSRNMRTVFVSSISSVQDWAAVFPDQDVAETPFESWDVASPLGYGQSKHVAERILAKSSAVLGTPVTILRVGQVAGPTDPSSSGGQWLTDEWIPSLAAISKTLRLVPKDIPPIDWMPVDQAARTIIELALPNEAASQQNPLRVFNVVNPHLSEWSTFSNALQRRLFEGGQCREVTLQEWVDTLVRTDPGNMSEAEARSSTKILPFFQHLAETASRGNTLQPRFSTAEAELNSVTMRQLGKIDEKLITRWLEQWGI